MFVSSVAHGSGFKFESCTSYLLLEQETKGVLL